MPTTRSSVPDIILNTGATIPQLGYAGEMAVIDALDRGPSGRVGPHPDSYEGV